MRSRLFAAICLLLQLAVLTPCIAATGAPASGTVEFRGPELTAGREAVPAGVVPATLSLDEAVAIGVLYNPQVTSSKEGVRLADALVEQAVSHLMPRLDVESSRVTPVHPTVFQSPNSTWQTTFRFSQPIYTGGAVSAGIKAARQFREGAVGSYDRTRQQIAFQVRAAYYAVLTAEEGVTVNQQVVDSAAETLRVARLRYQAGVAPQFDVLSAEARVARVEQGLIAARVARDIAWAALSTVMGVSIPPGTQLTTPRPASWEEQDFESLRIEAQANRPDLAAAQGQLAAARAQVAVAKAARQPTVAASLTYSLVPKTTVSFGEPATDIVVNQNSGFAVLSASWSLFNGGQVEGEVRQAQAQVRQAEDAVTSVKQQIDLDVTSAYTSVSAARAQVAAAQKEVAQAQEAFRVATIRYEEGVGTSVEILSAEADLADAKTRLNQSIFGLNLAVAQLDLALGRDATTQPVFVPDEREGR
ncbi:MAG: TolC family protein [Armatimonadota bacterium]